MPIYNKSSHIAEAVESVLHQTFDDWELILWDDGSTDGSSEICDEYAAKYPQKIYVYHADNKGALIARQSILNVANGDFIYLMDADDYLSYDVFFKEVHDKIVDNNADLLMFPLSERDMEDGYEDKTKKEIIELILTTDDWNSVCTKVYKKELGKTGPDYTNYEAILLGEDLFQFLPIFTRSVRLVLINKCYYYYRDTEDSGVYSFDIRQFNSAEIMRDRLMKYLELWNCKDKEHIALVNAKTIALLASIVRKIKYARDYTYSELKAYMKTIRESDVFNDTYGYRKHIPHNKCMVIWCLKHRLYFVIYVAFKGLGL